MTREEAKGFGYGFVDNSSNIQSQYVLLVHEVDEVIDKIYNDIESRVCENCKYQTDSSLCNAGVVYDNYMDRDTFGCNKFEVESK